MRNQADLPRICITATGETPAALLDCARSALAHSRFVELRLDWLPHPADALPLIPKLLEEAHLPSRAKAPILQATCRRRPNGGRFAGAVAEQLELLEKAATAGCRVLDLEVESAESAGKEAVASLRQQARLILSFHDFKATPSLPFAARRLQRFPADYYKLVVTATRQSDNCAVLDFLSSVSTEGTEWIAFCMGEAGIPSRVLALSRGSAFVYAAPPVASALPPTVLPIPPFPHAVLPSAARDLLFHPTAAPGQLDWETLRTRYRAERLTPDTALYGLLGCPVRHSVGAAIHNAAFRARGLDAVYLPLLATDLRDFRKAAQRYSLAGFSVTIPHKQSVLRFVDRADRSVEAAGAANTVRVRRGRWEAINTDIEGIQVPLRKALRLSDKGTLPADFRAVIVGNGGAARAAVVALRGLRCRDIWITGRNPVKVRRFAQQMGGRTLALESLGRERFDLLVHATSVGMWPQSEECFLKPEQLAANTVFDLVYNPPETRLLQIACARGCRTISGLEMFLAQAARQFQYWTGQQPPLRWMRQVALQELERLRHGSQDGDAGSS